MRRPGLRDNNTWKEVGQQQGHAPPPPVGGEGGQGEGQAGQQGEEAVKD